MAKKKEMITEKLRGDSRGKPSKKKVEKKMITEKLQGDSRGKPSKKKERNEGGNLISRKDRETAKKVKRMF